MSQAGGSALRLANVIIAGVNKAGTTSMFVSLAAHPQVAPSAVKETRFFLPLRYGGELPPLAEYASFFAGARNEPIRLEATPAYFYGGRRLATRVDEVLPGARILLSLREPVARFVSFFTFQKARLRLPEDMSLEEYVAACEQRRDDDFDDPANEPYFALRGGEYAQYLPAWLETFEDRLHVVFFDELVRDPEAVAREIAVWLGIDPDAFPAAPDKSENRTVGYRNRRLQRLALSANQRLERWLRRHPHLKRRLRYTYYRLNGKAARTTVPAPVAERLQQHYAEPNARLAEQLSTAGFRCPRWTEAPSPVV
jgi:hypothetical protein